ncbi:MAG TPA: TIGR03118 family protein, partial [Steroidobacteraceae bacterium]|nr:TIGR03118 family protein [Steroidobacteraceae bacterium]
AAMLALSACGGGDGYGGGGGGGGGTTAAPSGLSYTSPVTANVGTALTALNPAVTGSVTTYTVAPALPAGLALNSGTGVISGTPTATAAQATYTVTASNAGGSTTFALVLKVDPPTPSAYTQSPLVSDGGTTAAFTDVHLKNPWALAVLAGGPMWVSNNHDHTATVYDGTGIIQPVVVNIPAGANGTGDVTGMVASSSTTDFMVTNGTVTAPARFLFVTETGTLSGWAPTVNATNARIAYDDAGGGAIYKGLAIAGNGTATFLFAADFRHNRIDVFDKNFAKVTPSGGFTDSTLPAGFAPFNIQTVQISGATVLVVTYAKQDGTGTEEVVGAGEGLVNTFDLNGALLKHLVPRGAQLNAPWGVALAPATGFGSLSNALLIGNFGDGKINGFDATTGAFIHEIRNASGAPIANAGLWGITFGYGARNQPVNVLYLAAGINGEANGLYARIDLGATAPDIVAPTGVSVTAPAAAATVSGTTDVTANASDNVGVARVVFSVRVGTTTTEIATDTTAPYSASWNTGAVANGAATLFATAFDAFGNSTASANVAVTVNNVADVTPPTVSLTAPAGGDVSGVVTVSANAADNVGVAQVQFFAGATAIGTDTTAPYTVQWNTTTFTGALQLTAVAKDGAGNTTTSAAVGVNVITAPTTAQLQSSIFTPRCSGCHTGGGATLPASMNLSSESATQASLVGVTSAEVPTLARVNPGNPGSSYIINKLEGTQTVGARMPLGGPFLSTTEINQVKAWIQAGAFEAPGSEPPNPYTP